MIRLATEWDTVGQFIFLESSNQVLPQFCIDKPGLLWSGKRRLKLAKDQTTKKSCRLHQKVKNGGP